MEHREIMQAMTLAPSAHNTQPWLFRSNKTSIDVFVDWSRHLAISDPTHRQLFLSIGSAVCNGVVLAAQQGLVATVELFSSGEGKDDPVARLSFEQGAVNEHLTALVSAVADRRTDRSLYDGEPLTPTERDWLKSTYDADVELIQDQAVLEVLARLTGEGSYATLARQDFKNELSQWVRSNWTSKPDGMPGYAMGMPAPLSLVSPLLVRIAPIHKQEQTQTARQVQSASAVVLISSDEDTPRAWVNAGQLLQQAWLEATAAGLASGVLEAAIESGDELRAEVQVATQTTKKPQALLRVGHSSRVSLRATPRRSVDDCLLHQ